MAPPSSSLRGRTSPLVLLAALIRFGAVQDTDRQCSTHQHALLCIQVGVDPRLRELTQQLLLAVTNAEAVEEAVLVLITDAAADTAAQVLAAAERLVPMLQQATAAQVLDATTASMYERKTSLRR